MSTRLLVSTFMYLVDISERSTCDCVDVSFYVDVLFYVDNNTAILGHGTSIAHARS